MEKYIELYALLRIVNDRLAELRNECGFFDHYAHGYEECVERIEDAPAVDVVEVDKVAKMLFLSFGDSCACNFNGNDEWMWEKCKYAETECPFPKDELGCWKEFVKHFIAKMDEKSDSE